MRGESIGQRLLFDQSPAPEPPHVVGSETSRQAAESIRRRGPQLRERVFQCIAGRGTAGATDEEVCDALGIAGNTVRPRRRELEQAGRVVDSGIRRPTQSGRAAVVWVSFAYLLAARPAPHVDKVPF